MENISQKNATSEFSPDGAVYSNPEGFRLHTMD
jgi:hypothetical protein